MTYHVQFTDYAEENIAKLTSSRRQEIKDAAKRALGRDPYGWGSTQIRNDRDRREVTLANVFLSYDVSPNVVVVSVVKISAPFD
ncbi:hypothetical protein [Embleya sp. AB8]|uniref:hypothetical protein n=1 Tax=Embleya sp. AB8 TaxID=3156304 RepID=UPI003C786EB2